MFNESCEQCLLNRARLVSNSSINYIPLLEHQYNLYNFNRLTSRLENLNIFRGDISTGEILKKELTSLDKLLALCKSINLYKIEKDFQCQLANC